MRNNISLENKATAFKNETWMLFHVVGEKVSDELKYWYWLSCNMRY